ncbi:SAM-dependent methyltransferase [Embleya scabrispora]|uniref:SAM-dependent methyltransferase n=1 Tax=Embleya scabrispora TaxID=159449 RepID=UPI0003A82C10|nr:SAM-dependent methyltransferase [Embleya scabrispora]MYS83733.1 SAM-dependent methyltransferase [Streptomyces sp. SID5474]
MSGQDWAPTGIDVSRPHPARVYDYHIGGKTNYPAERFIEVAPQTSVTARDNRAFLGRAVRYAAEQGIDRFLDIGTGIPAPGNTHEVAQEIVPSARVAYVDNDPIVLAHARALMPVAILHYVSAAEDPAGVVNRLLEAVPSGSLLIASHTTSDFLPPISAERVLEINDDAEFMLPRPYAEIASFLTGVELVEPGLVQAPLWRPEEDADLSPERPAPSWIYTAVGRKA